MSNARQMTILAKETAIYGVSSIVGKFLNYLLVPLYTYVLKQQADYGIVTNLYAWTALLLVILTYGMETGFFRFANRADEDANTVYKTAWSSLLVTSVLFAAVCVLLRKPIATGMGYGEHSEFIALMAVTVAMDAFASIPFASLRYRKQPLVFAGLKLLFVVLNIGFNLLFLLVLDRRDVRYVFISNLMATGIQTAILIPLTLPRGGRFSALLLRQMIRYSLPLLVLGVAGIMNQTLDRILFPYLHPAIITTNAELFAQPYAVQVQSELGIYGACFKVAMVMMMFTQAFRYAYEPFVFAKHRDKNSVEAYADAMKYYVICSLLILMGVVVYLDIFKFIISPDYWEGLRIVPIVLWTYVFQGIYFNLSFWYKLTDKTQYGAYFSLTGLVITLLLQVLLVPRMGYIASAASSGVCYLVIMLLSYAIGQRHLKVPYDTKRIGLYMGVTILLLAVYYVVGWRTDVGMWVKMGLGTVLIAVYIGMFYKLDGHVFRNH